MPHGLGWQLAGRNIRRRRGEAALVVLGSMLGTAIIAAAFVVGNSFGDSLRDTARTTLGPIDETVTIRPPVSQLDQRLARLADRVAHASVPGTDGMLVARSASAVLAGATSPDGLLTDPDTCALEVSAAEARHFGPDAAIGGFTDVAHSPAAGTAYVNRDEAERLGIEQGDRLAVHAYGGVRRFRVARVLEQVGIAGYCGVVVPPGTIVAMAAHSTAAAQPPAGLVLVSNDGGVFDSTAGSARVARGLRAAVGRGAGADVESVKADALRNAASTGASLQTLFSAIGGFSVIAGILLLVNLFVMLAEERKVELGVLRAIGLKRSGVWRAFSVEGAIYAVSSSILGTALGVGIGWLVVLGTNQVFRDPHDRFAISLSARPSSLLIAAGIGIAISMLTVWITSTRIARLNVISAVRDLPDPRRVGRRLGRLLLAAAGVIGGGIATVSGLASGAEFAILAGPPLACFSAIALLSRIAAEKLVSFVMSALAIVWCLGVFVFFPDEMAQPGIGVFVLMGVLLVGAAVTIATTLDGLWDRITLSLTERGRGLALRLALAYPLARRFRTGMILGMFSLVIFTMTFMAAFAAILGDSASSGVRDIDAGFDLIVDSNRANPITPVQLVARDDVADVAPLLRADADLTIRYQPDPSSWPVTGFTDELLAHGAPRLSDRDPRYPDDRAVFQAVLRHPDLVVVDSQFLQDAAAPASNAPRIGDRVELLSSDRTRHRLRVVGVLRSDFAFHGALISSDTARRLLAPAYVEDRQFVKVAPGQDPARVARRLDAELVDHGADAQTFRQRVDENLSHTTGFIRLMEVYLAFGMLIGVAGLGVVMVRAVRERRREIGMLRAMGVSAWVVRRAFLLEAGFIAVQSVLTGVGLGLVTTDQVVVNSGAFATSSAAFTVPWLAIAVIAAVPIVASLLATISPAHRAARIRPARALRPTD
jgi:putative ABC transport system permease protein